jgi:hypothetical protein
VGKILSILSIVVLLRKVTTGGIIRIVDVMVLEQLEATKCHWNSSILEARAMALEAVDPEARYLIQWFMKLKSEGVTLIRAEKSHPL